MRGQIAILGFGIREFLTLYLHFARNCLIISLSCDSKRIITLFGRPLEHALLPLCHKYNVFFWHFCPMFPRVPIFFVRVLIFMLSEPFSPLSHLILLSCLIRHYCSRECIHCSDIGEFILEFEEFEPSSFD